MILIVTGNKTYKTSKTSRPRAQPQVQVRWRCRWAHCLPQVLSCSQAEFEVTESENPPHLIDQTMLKDPQPPPNMSMPPPGAAGMAPSGPPPPHHHHHGGGPPGGGRPPFKSRFGYGGGGGPMRGDGAGIPGRGSVPPGPPTLGMTAEDFDGKRLRKSMMRKTVDYNSSFMLMLERRLWQRDFRDRRALQPDVMYYPEMLPPCASVDNPANAITTKFVKTATNKMRCPVFTLAWTPEGRRLITGASSGEFTLWNGLTFNFETILQAHDSPVR